MSITKSIGKNTLGGGNSMKVDLKTHNRSTHNLSYAWRSSMGVGTLVPCMKFLEEIYDKKGSQVITEEYDGIRSLKK